MWPGDSEGISETTAQDRAFACQFAKSIAANLADISAAVRQEWASDDGFAAALIAPGPDKPYHDDKEVTLELFKSFTTALQQTRGAKLNRVLMGNPQEAKPRRAAFWRSGNAIPPSRPISRPSRICTAMAGCTRSSSGGDTRRRASTIDQFGLIEEALDGLRPGLSPKSPRPRTVGPS